MLRFTVDDEQISEASRVWLRLVGQYEWTCAMAQVHSYCPTSLSQTLLASLICSSSTVKRSMAPGICSYFSLPSRRASRRAVGLAVGLGALRVKPSHTKGSGTTVGL